MKVQARRCVFHFWVARNGCFPSGVAYTRETEMVHSSWDVVAIQSGIELPDDNAAPYSYARLLELLGYQLQWMLKNSP